MRTDFFYWLLNMSIAGTVTGLLLLLLGRIKAIPRGFLYPLWLVPAFRFLAPVSFSSRYSVMNLVLKLRGRVVPFSMGQGGDAEAQSLLYLANYHQAAREVLPVQDYQYRWLEGVFYAASWIWLVVVVVLVAGVLISWFRTNRQLKSAGPDAAGLYRRADVRGPLVFGLWQPQIAVPLDWDRNSQSGAYALRHERVHVTRRDNVFRLGAVLIACLHWFNPCVWLLLRQFFADLELSCDEAVIRELGKEEKREYAATLLHQLEQKNVLLSAFGGAGLQGRIERILTYRQLTGLAWLAVLLLVVAMAYVMIGNGV